MDMRAPFSAVASALTTAPSVAAPLTIATLWRAAWTEAQGSVAAWLSKENFPFGSRFIWSYQEGGASEQHLVRLQEILDATNNGYQFTLVAVHERTPRFLEEKHLLVSELYNDILADVSTSTVLLVEDDNVAEPNGGNRLIAHFDRLPVTAGALMGAYRSRPNPIAICAGSLQQNYLLWEDCIGESPIEARWIGAGFSLYRACDLQSCLPATAIISRTPKKVTITGWDAVVSARLRTKGKKLFVDPTVRVLHACPEVLEYCGLPQLNRMPAVRRDQEA